MSGEGRERRGEGEEREFCVCMCGGVMRSENFWELILSSHPVDSEY